MKPLRIYSNDWSKDSIHGVAVPAGYRWRALSSGIHVEAETGPRRTKGAPVTLTRVKESFGNDIDVAASRFHVDAQLLAAVVAAETKGDARAERFEGHLFDYSFGLCQTLTRTANNLMLKHRLGTPPPISAWDEWRDVLFKPLTSLTIAAAYLNDLNLSQGLRGDPVLLYAAYNSGTARPGDTPWGLVYYRKVLSDGKVIADAMNSFVSWYGDACAVYSGGR